MLNFMVHLRVLWTRECAAGLLLNFERDARSKTARVVATPDVACEVGDLASLGGAGEADGLAFRFAVEGTLASLPRRWIEEKIGGVTGAHVLANASNLGALPTELFGIAPEAGIEPATPALSAK
jgi:hypothetical protein